MNNNLMKALENIDSYLGKLDKPYLFVLGVKDYNKIVGTNLDSERAKEWLRDIKGYLTIGNYIEFPDEKINYYLRGFVYTMILSVYDNNTYITNCYSTNKSYNNYIDLIDQCKDTLDIEPLIFEEG